MTQTLGVNANNDIYIGANGNLVVLQGEAAVGAACLSTSKASLGEEVFAQNSGLPFFQAVFVGVPNLATYENALLTALLAVDGVVGVSNLTSSLSKNQQGRTVLNYSVTIENEYGLLFQASGEITQP